MSTPYDNITWRLRNINPNPPPPCTLLEPVTNSNNGDQPANLGTNSIYTSPYPKHHPPLRSHTKFKIKIVDDESVIIVFKNAPPNIKTIWANAQNVYYDREFYAVRGELMYNKNTGESSSYFGSHFVISYDGRMATGGSSRQLSVNLYDEPDIAIPTFNLLHRWYEFDCAPGTTGGSWNADED